MDGLTQLLQRAGVPAVPIVDLALFDAGKADHQGLLVALWLDPATAAQLAAPGGETAASLHITLCYCGDVSQLGDVPIAEAITAVARLVEASAPLRGATAVLDRFEPTVHSDGQVPVIMRVAVPGLMAFRAALADALTTAGVPPRANFEYQPHITLAYIAPGTPGPLGPDAPVALAFDGVTITIGEARTTIAFGIDTRPVRPPTIDLAFDESDHPRDADGKFATTGEAAARVVARATAVIVAALGKSRRKLTLDALTKVPVATLQALHGAYRVLAQHAPTSAARLSAAATAQHVASTLARAPRPTIDLGDDFEEQHPRDRGRFVAKGTAATEKPTRARGGKVKTAKPAPAHGRYARVGGGWSDEPQTSFFHGTTSAALDAIRAQGLVPAGGAGADAWLGRTYTPGIDATGKVVDAALATSVETVAMIADRKASVFLTDSLIVASEYAKNVRDTHPGSESLRLRITIPTEHVERLKHDEASTADKRSIRYRGAIPPEWIEVVTRHSDPAPGEPRLTYHHLAADGEALVLHAVVPCLAGARPHDLAFDEGDHPRDADGKFAGSFATSDEIPEYTGQDMGDRISTIQDVPIAQLTPTETAIDEPKVRALMAAMRAGDPLPAIVTEFGGETDDGRDLLDVVDGHHRLEAASRLGADTVPVRVKVAPDDWPKVKQAGGMRVITHLAFDEGDHPRDADGQFASGGGAPTLTGHDVQALAPALATAAQAVYDAWDEADVDTYAEGGICHIIADEIAGALAAHGIDATPVSAAVGEQHVFVVAKLKDGVYTIDIPPGTYERGGGYSWQKVPGVQITHADVTVDRIDRDPARYADYLDLAFDEADHPRAADGTFASDGAPFSEWFGASKVVDRHGDPLVVYHGSVERGLPASALDPAATPVRARTGPAGVYFTSRRDAAAGFTRRPGAGIKAKAGSVVAAHLSLQRPLDITAAVKAGQKRGLTFGDAKRAALAGLTPEHDGVIFRGDRVNNDEYIAFRPAQIRAVPVTSLSAALHLFDEDQHPRDAAGKFTDGADDGFTPTAARTFTSEQGYAWHEEGPVAAWGRALGNDQREVLTSYASFGSVDINNTLRGAPPMKEDKRVATEAEAALIQAIPLQERQGVSLPTADGGQLRFNWYAVGPSKYEVVRDVVDAERAGRAHSDANAINAAIAEHGYELPEAVAVSRGAYFPGVTVEDLRASVGTIREEPGFLSTSVGDAQGRQGMTPAGARAESIYRRFHDVTHKEVGTAATFSIILPKGTHVASVEAARRTGPHDYSDTLSKGKDYRSESELLLGSGARFKVISVKDGPISKFVTDYIPTQHVTMEYVGGGASQGRVRRDLAADPPPVVARDTQPEDRFTWSDWSQLREVHARPVRPYLAKIHALAFDEGDHPRDAHGQFATAVGGAMDALREAHPVVATNYTRSTYTEQGSIGKHTGEVGDRWATQITPAELAGISDRWGSDVGRLMAHAIALHDIGKADAVEAGESQHAHTVPILEAVLTKEGFRDQDVRLASALVDHDLLGHVVRGIGDETPAEVATAIAQKAADVGMAAADFATLQLALYHADAGAYPYVRDNFMRADDAGKLTMARPAARERLAPIVALTHKGRTDLAFDEADHPRDERGQFAEATLTGFHGSPDPHLTALDPAERHDRPRKGDSSVMGTFIASTADAAQHYATATGRVYPVTVTGPLATITQRDFQQQGSAADFRALRDRLQAEGFVGARIPHLDETVVWHPDAMAIQSGEDGISRDGQISAAGLDRRFPRADDTVDGRTVTAGPVKNTASIAAGLPDYTVLPGIRSVPLAAFEHAGPPSFYSQPEEARTHALAATIARTGTIAPLIVVVDTHRSPYILEGGHRFDALRLLKATAFPALVVVDTEDQALVGARPHVTKLRALLDATVDLFDEAQITRDDHGRFADQASGGGRAETSTPAFKAWFGTSAVVDDQGRPAVMYHATTANIETFRPFTHFGDQGAAGARNETVVDFYRNVVKREDRATGENVMPVYLSIQEPLRLPDLAAVDAQSGRPIDEAQAEFDALDEDAQAHRQETGEEPRARAWEGEGDLMQTLYERDVVTRDEFWEHQYAKDDAVVALLKEKGYDGIVYENAVEHPGHDSWIIFDATQVKSALGNAGTFDPTNPKVHLAFDEASVTRDDRGRFAGSGMPPEAGTLPVPPGMIRGYHYTSAEALPSILREGLSTSHAKGSTYGEPNVIWMSAQKPQDYKSYVEVHVTPDEMHPGIGRPPMVVKDATTGHFRNAETDAERQQVIDEFNAGTRNFALAVPRVPASRIATHSTEGIAFYHRLRGDPRIVADIVAGKHDALERASPAPDKHGIAIAAIKADAAARKDLAFDEGDHPRDDHGRFAASAGPLSQDTLTQFADHLRDTHGLAVMDLRLHPNGDLELESMAAKKGQQGEGAGTRAMTALTAFADDHQRRIVLSLGKKGYQPIEGGVKTSSAGRLKTFYRRFGFVSNAGRNKDFALSLYTNMYRRPTPPRTDLAFDEADHPRDADGKFASGGGLTLHDDATPEAFIAARDRSTRLGYLSPLTPDDLKGHRLYLSPDGTVGGAMTPEGDMGNLFNNGGPKGAATEVLLRMIADGGKTADCYDGFLPTLYANFGLQQTGRMKFDPAYAPAGWNHGRDGAPDVVFLALTRDVGSPDTIRARLASRTDRIAPERTTRYHDDYAEGHRTALAAADAALAVRARREPGGARSLGGLRDDSWRGLAAGPSGDGPDRSARPRLRVSPPDPFDLDTAQRPRRAPRRAVVRTLRAIVARSLVASRRYALTFDESQHPRDDRGRFGDGDGAPIEAKPVGVQRTPEERLAIVRHRADSVAREMGVDPKRIDVVDIDPRPFTVGNLHMEEAGHYNPATGQIEINARNSYYDRMSLTNGIVAHEVFHLEFDAVTTAQRVEHEAILNLPPAEFSRLFLAAGGVRPEARDEVTARYPASAAWASTDYGDSILGNRHADAHAQAVDALYPALGHRDEAKAAVEAIAARQALPESASIADREKDPAYAAALKTYQHAERAFGEAERLIDATSPAALTQKMIDENGHSAYAKTYWTPEALRTWGQRSAINETLAEVTRYRLHPASWSEHTRVPVPGLEHLFPESWTEGGPSQPAPKSPWVQLQQAITTVYPKIKR